MSSSSDTDDGLVVDDLDWNVPYESNTHPSTVKGAGENCELKRYDALFNARGNRVVLPAGSTRSINYGGDFGFSSALTVTKFWSKEKDFEYTELEIKSPHMKAALKAVVPYYKDFRIELKHIVLRDEPECLFHYREELQHYGMSLQDPEAAKHVLFLLQYMWRELSTELFTFYSTMENPGASATLDFQNLWMAFKPDELLYLRYSTSNRFKQEEVIQLTSMERCKCDRFNCSRNNWWRVSGTVLNYDGENFGYEERSLIIRRYEGYRPVHELPIFPLRYHPRREDIRTRLVARGKKFCTLQGMHYQQYNGIAELLGDNRNLGCLGENDQFPLRSTLVSRLDLLPWLISF
jgi:hypothetical protein